jgi:hypothetical protein
MTTGGGRGFSVPVGGARFLVFQRAIDLLSADQAAFADVRDQPLGTQRIAGVETTGRRVTIVVPAGYRGNVQAIEMVTERWESTQLQLLIQSRQSDPRSTIEYRLSNIQRTEPPANLFEIPVDYAVDYSTTPNDPWLSFAAAKSPRASEFSGRPEHAMSSRRDLRSGLQPAFSSTIPRLIPSRPCRTGRRRSKHAVRAKPESE